MTQSHDDHTPVEHDPTGMRALLAGLPDPGPMPPDLVTRITAALAAEASTDAGATASAAASPATVVPLPRRRLGLRHLGVAAAVVTAVGLGGVVLSGGASSFTASITAGGSSDSAAAGGESVSKDASGAGGRAVAPLVPAAGTGGVVVVMSGRSYSAADLADGARELLARPPEALPPLGAEAPGIGPIGTPIGARACADALGVPADAGVLVDVADVDGRPGAVLVTATGDTHSAYAVDRSCTTGNTGPASGPVALD